MKRHEFSGCSLIVRCIKESNDCLQKKWNLICSWNLSATKQLLNPQNNRKDLCWGSSISHTLNVCDVRAYCCYSIGSSSIGMKSWENGALRRARFSLLYSNLSRVYCYCLSCPVCNGCKLAVGNIVVLCVLLYLCVLL